MHINKLSKRCQLFRVCFFGPKFCLVHVRCFVMGIFLVSNSIRGIQICIYINICAYMHTIFQFLIAYIYIYQSLTHEKQIYIYMYT